MANTSACNKNIFTIIIYFFIFSDSVYVDHAGTTLYSKSQIEAYHAELLSNLYGNPHSRIQSSRLTADVIDQIRYRYEFLICHIYYIPGIYDLIWFEYCNLIGWSAWRKIGLHLITWVGIVTSPTYLFANNKFK